MNSRSYCQYSVLLPRSKDAVLSPGCSDERRLQDGYGQLAGHRLLVQCITHAPQSWSLSSASKMLPVKPSTFLCRNRASTPNDGLHANGLCRSKRIGCPRISGFQTGSAVGLSLTIIKCQARLWLLVQGLGYCSCGQFHKTRGQSAYGLVLLWVLRKVKQCVS